MQELKIDGLRYALTVHQRDEALPYLLMLHGFMGDSRSFNHLIKDLCHTCNPVTLDLLGHGQTQSIHEPERYREELQIDDLRALVTQTIDNPPFIYGYSMGGRLALKTVTKEQGLFRGMILESTNPGIFDATKRAERKVTDLKRAREIEKDYPTFLEKWEKLPLFQSPIKQDPSLINSYKKMHRQQDPKSMAASLRGFGTGFMKPFTQDDIQFKGPALLLAGSEDHKYIAINKQIEKKFSNASNQILKAGHRVHLDNPPAFTRLMNSFIEQNA